MKLNGLLMLNLIKLTDWGSVEVSTVIWGSRNTLVPFKDDCTEPGSPPPPLLLLLQLLVLCWLWLSSAMVLRLRSELCRLASFSDLGSNLGSLGSLAGLALNRAGGVGGVRGGRLLASPEVGMIWAGGPRITRRTGKNTRPLKRPRITSASRTRKKYLKTKNTEFKSVKQCLHSNENI